MIYTIEFELPDNETVIKNIKTARVSWSVWGYSGVTHVQPVDKDTNVPCTDTQPKNENEPIKQAQIAPNEDLISRKTAIEAMESAEWYHQNQNKDMVRGANSAEHQAWYKADDVHRVLERLPSAQPERKKGEWIDYTEDGYVECPFCHSATNCDGNKDELHFCFSCGADMREPEDIPMEYFESGGR